MWLAIHASVITSAGVSYTKVERVPDLQRQTHQISVIVPVKMSDVGIQQETEPQVTVRHECLNKCVYFFEAESYNEWFGCTFVYVRLKRVRTQTTSFLQVVAMVEAVKRKAKTRKGSPRKAVKKVWPAFFHPYRLLFFNEVDFIDLVESLKRSRLMAALHAVGSRWAYNIENIEETISGF